MQNKLMGALRRRMMDALIEVPETPFSSHSSSWLPLVRPWIQASFGKRLLT